MRQDVDIARNLKTTEWLKAELVGEVGDLMRAMVTYSSDKMLDSLSTIVINAYLLGKRLGFDYDDLGRTLQMKLQDNIEKEHEIEKWYGDLSSLQRYTSGIIGKR